MFVVAALPAFFLIVEWRWPMLFDPEYAVRLRVLRQRVAEKPGQPLLLMIGSSRTVMNFLPEMLPPLQDSSGQPVLVFNFSHLGAGPVMNLIEVRRLLRAGLRPRWLIAELMPPTLGDDSQSIILDTTSGQDAPLVLRYTSPWQLCGHVVRHRLNPWYKYRLLLQQRLIPDWVPKNDRQGEPGVVLDPLGGSSGWVMSFRMDAARAAQCLNAARADYCPSLQNFRIAGISARAIHELVGLCRHEGIQLVFLLTPEGKTFRSWYPPAACRLIDQFCEELVCDDNVPLVDARDWLAEEHFIDSHHASISGAEAFTRRLGPEILQPLVRGQLRKTSVAGR